MSSPNYFVHERENVAWAIAPANYSGAASTDQYFSLKQYQAVCFVIQTGAWAAGTAAVTLLQGTDVSGTASKAVAFATVWTKTSTDDTPTSVAVVSNTFNLDTANKLYFIEVRSSDLDVNNAFTTVACHVATPGSNADYYSAVAVLNLPRFQAASPPSALLN